MYDEINLVKFDPPRITPQNRCTHKLTDTDACARPCCRTHTHVYLVGLYERDNCIEWQVAAKKERTKGFDQRWSMFAVSTFQAASLLVSRTALRTVGV